MIPRPEPEPPDDDTGSDGTAGGEGGGGESYSIGELAKQFDITTRAIRFYESRGLLAPGRIGTTRNYTRRDRARLILILRGKNLGFTLEDIAEYLALYDTDPGQVAQTRLLLDKVDAHIADMHRKKGDLDRALRDLKDIRVQCLAHIRAAKRRERGER